MAKLVLEQVTKRFGNVAVINGVDLEIAHGEFIVFVGPSGCGKSTILRVISGLEAVSTGRVLIDNHDVTHTAPAKRGVAMVFQSYALFPHMTVAQNIGFGLKLARIKQPEIDERVAKVAKVLHLEQLLNRLPKQLSGGQRQRVAIGRSIIRDPQVFLFDEPLSNLDAALRVRMRLEIARLRNRLDATMVYVTHDQTEAMTLADRIVVLNGGRIEQVGSPMDLYHKPETRFVAGFIGSPSMNFLAAIIKDVTGNEVAVEYDGRVISGIAKRCSEFRVGQRVTLGIRPDELKKTTRAGIISGRIANLEYLGNHVIAYAQTKLGEQLTVQLAPFNSLRANQDINLTCEASSWHVFA